MIVIQSLESDNISTGGIRPKNTLTFNLGQQTGSGNLLVVAFSCTSQDFDTNGITDDANNVYTLAIELDGAGDGDGACSIYYIESSSPASVISVGISLGQTCSGVFYEIQGALSSGSLDSTVSFDDITAGISISPGSITAAIDEFIVTVCTGAGTGNTVTTADSPFDTNFVVNDGVDSTIGFSYIITSAAATYTPNFELSAGGSGALSVAASFKPASSTPPVTNFNFLMTMGCGA